MTKQHSTAAGDSSERGVLHEGASFLLRNVLSIGCAQTAGSIGRVIFLHFFRMCGFCNGIGDNSQLY